MTSLPLSGIPDARVIEVDSLPAHLSGALRVVPGLEARPGAVFINLPQVARYLVTNGVAIEVAPMPRAEPEAVSLFLDFAARAALIHERGELPLVSTTVVSPAGRCVALCGLTGIGKSTVAAALTKRGWSLVAEGVTRLVLEGNEVRAYPSHAELRLWRDACELLGVDFAGLRRVRPQLQKFYLPVKAAAAPMRLDTIVRLQPDRRIQVPAKNFSPRRLVEDATYRIGLVAALDAATAYERIAGAVLDGCRIESIEGGDAIAVEELADRVAEIVS